jgi:hypothetical protein
MGRMNGKSYYLTLKVTSRHISLVDTHFIHQEPQITLALKWRQIKVLMTQDIKKIRIATKGHKIVTKHEWMMSALDLLE